MKLGIAGTGKIVKEALYALAAVPEIEVNAIFGRPHSRAKAETLAAEYGIPRVYSEYEMLLEDDGCGTIYIGLVTGAHYDYAKRALLAGRHVILEKPLTTTAAQAVELTSLARERGLYLLEAVTSLHCAVFRKMKETLPSLGRISLVQGNYSQYSSRYEDYLNGVVLPAFDPALSGGALYDINIYNINLMTGLFGEPRNIRYLPRLGFNGIDTAGILTCEYDGFPAVAVGAKDSDSPCHFTVQGEKGWMQVVGKPNECSSLKICTGGNIRSFRPEPERHRMVPEFREFLRIVDENDASAAARCMENSTAVMRMAQAARLSAGIHFPEDE